MAASRVRDDELERLRKDAAEVHRLRSEIAQLSQQKTALVALEAENQRLRQHLSRTLGALSAQQLLEELLEARVAAQKNACFQNLRQIDSAKEQWGLENKKIVGAPTTEAAVNAYFRNGAQPVCPAGGTYTYGPLGTNPTCSLGASAGHTL